ncbi:MAG: indole-3-glycerol phosphate synthase TrpC [Ktedonobacterales bacterium]
MSTEQTEHAATFLERILAATREELAERQARLPLDEVRAQVADAPAPHNFAAALRPRPANGPARLIAEIKRASPSKGLLAETFDPVAQATAYAAGGAAAISVLTEPRFFLGSLDHLRAVRAAVDIPVLRKDFVIDAYQVYEARAAGADAVLLICALLEDAPLADLLGLIRSLGMEALTEAHNAEEVERAVRVGASVIGVNSRDLRTFQVDTEVVRRLRPLVPADRVFVAESGIFDATGAAQARARGADAILVGEALMRSPDPTMKVRELTTAAGGPLAAFFAGMGEPFIKICGLAAPEQAQLVAELGADAFGLVFAPMAPSHRRLTPDQAVEIVAAIKSPLGVSGGRPPTPQTKRPLAIGVFVNERAETLAEIAAQVRLDALQLSGDESPDDCALIAERTQLPIIKALRLSSDADMSLLDAYVAAGAIPLLDTPAQGITDVTGAYGGAGQTGDWARARRAADRWPILLAGGLTPDNITDALATVAPRGVDVSSGVESLLPEGKAKDPDKIRRFIEQAREAGRQPPGAGLPAGHSRQQTSVGHLSESDYQRDRATQHD